MANKPNNKYAFPSTCRFLVKMEWANDTVLRFLELYKMHPCIWDPKNASHKNKMRRIDAWNKIKNNLGVPCTVSELKKKRESLMSAYRGYRSKVKKSKIMGTDASDVYQPTWFAYSLMNSFLGDVYKCRTSLDTEDDLSEQDIEASNTDDTSTWQQDPSCTVFKDPQGSLSSVPKKRRRHNPAQLRQAKDQMDAAFNILRTISQHHHNNDEDESSIFGKLIAEKMRKLPEDRRDLMMIQINQLFYEECHENHKPSSLSPPYQYTG